MYCRKYRFYVAFKEDTAGGRQVSQTVEERQLAMYEAIFEAGNNCRI